MGEPCHTAEFAELIDGSVDGSDASLYDHDEDDATLIANPADEDLQAALAELLGEPGPTQQTPTERKEHCASRALPVRRLCRLNRRPRRCSRG